MPTMEVEVDWDHRPKVTWISVDYVAHVEDWPEFDEVDFIQEDGTTERVRFAQLPSEEQFAVQSLVDEDYTRKLNSGYFDPPCDDLEDCE